MEPLRGINIEGKGSEEQKVRATKPLRQHVRRPQTKLVKKFLEPIQARCAIIIVYSLVL